MLHLETFVGNRVALPIRPIVCTAMQDWLYINMENNFVLFSHIISSFMRRLDDFTQQKNRQIGIQYFDQYFCTCANFPVQIFWPCILKFSRAFSVNHKM